MARIVCVHGIAQQLKGPEMLALEWRTALRDGMRLAGAASGEIPSDDSIAVAFYGDLFRGRKKGVIANATLADIEPGLETDLLLAWAAEAGTVKSEHDRQPDSRKAGWAPPSVQDIAVKLLGFKFFAELTDACLVGALKQVRWYLTEPETRQTARERLTSLLSDETRVVIAHSLGSVVAYEVLCRAAPPVAPAFVTLGSPLGLPNLIFNRLDPTPVNGQGIWPATITSWTNIADVHDIVAAVKKLSPFFAGRVTDVEVNNEALAHDIGPYFTAPPTGQAVLDALREN